MRPLKIYTASKLKHADMWRDWAKKVPYTITSRWWQYHVGNVPDSPTFAKFFWKEDLEDVEEADLVLCYADPKDVLRGALIECGMAIALDKPVIMVGENESTGTWSYHPNVYKVLDLEEARLMLSMMQNALNKTGTL